MSEFDRDESRRVQDLSERLGEIESVVQDIERVLRGNFTPEAVQRALAEGMNQTGMHEAVAQILMERCLEERESLRDQLRSLLSKIGKKGD